MDVSGISEVVQVAAGFDHSMAMLANGQVWTWGSDSNGQLGNGGANTNLALPAHTAYSARRIAAGFKHSIILWYYDSIYMAGANGNGQTLGDPAVTANRITFDYIGSFAARPQACLGGLGNHTVLVQANGTVTGWGDNSFGQIGNGTTATAQTTQATAIAGWSLDHFIAVDAGNAHSVALKADGTVWTWGADNRGQLGNDAALANQYAPVQVSGLVNVVEIAAGGYHSLALASGGGVWSWGEDGVGQLGNGTFSGEPTFQPVPVAVSGLFAVHRIAAGANHSLAAYNVYNNPSAVAGWGTNSSGQLGTGSVGSANQSPVTTGFTNVIDMDGGWQHSVVARASGQVQTVGVGSSGQLGNNSTAQALTPVTAVFQTVPPIVLTLPVTGATHIAAGQVHTLGAVTGTVYGWGANYAGQLGNGTTNQSQVAVQGMQPGRDVAAGPDFGDFSLALRASGEVYATGSDSQGQLGNDTAIANVASQARVGTLARIAAIAAGDYHGLALRADGTLFSWGGNGSGQLGTALTTTPEPVPVLVSPTWRPLVTITALQPNAGETGPTGGTLRITRSLVNAGSLVVAYTVAGSAAAGNDYAILSGQAVIPAGSASVDVPITVLQDNDDEDSETVVATLVSGSAYRVGTPNQATVTIADDDTSGVTVGGISQKTSEAEGPSTPRTFTVVLTSRPSANVTLSFQSSNVQEGVVDANPLAGNQGAVQVVFTPATWNAARTIQVFGVDDDLDDGDVPYQVQLLPVASADVRYNGLNPADVGITNLDDDTAGVVVASSLAGPVSEGGGGSAFLIRLTSRPYQPVSFTIETTDTDEVQIDSMTRTVVLDAGTWNTGVLVQAIGVDDDLDDGDQIFTLGVAKSQSADPAYNNRGGWSVTGLCLDDDTRGILVENAVLAVGEGATASSTTVRLATRPIGTGSITLVFTADAQVTIDADPVAPGLQASLTILTDSYDTARQILVAAANDPDIEGSHTGSVTVTVQAPGGDYAGEAAGLVADITDDDAAAIVLSPSTSPTNRQPTDESGGTALINVRLAARPAPSTTVTVSVTSSDLTEGVASPVTLQFNRDTWNVFQQVVVTGQDDLSTDLDQDYRIDFLAAAGDPPFNGITQQQWMRNADNDVPGIQVVLAGGVLALDEAAPAATRSFSVRLNTLPAADVAVDLAAIGGLSIDRTSLFFNPASSATAQTVVVTFIDDLVDQGMSHTGTITITSRSMDADYQSPGLTTPDLLAAITDDDTAGIVVGPAGGLSTSEAGSQATVLISLTSQPTAPVTIPLVSADPGEIVLGSAAVTFTAADWFVPRNVTVTGVDDDVADRDQVAAVLIGRPATSADAVYAAIEPSDVLVTNRDDDVAAVIIDEGDGLAVSEGGATDAYTVVLATRPTAAVVITVNAGSQVTATAASLVFDPAVDHPAATAWNTPRTVAVAAVDDAFAEGEHGATILHTVSGGDYGAVQAASLPVVISDASGPGADAPGIAVVVASDLEVGEGGTQRTFTLTLTSQPFSNVTVLLSSTAAAEGVLSPTTLTFTPAAYGAQQVTLTGVDDAVADGDRAFAVLFSAFSGDANYNALSITALQGVNRDDDVAGLVAATAGALTTSEAGDVAQFTLRLRSQPTSQVSITFSSSATAEAAVTTNTLVFSPSDWFLPQVVEIQGVDDDVADGASLLSVAAATTAVVSLDPVYGNAFALTLLVTNQDDDAVGISFTAPSVSVTEGGSAVSVGVVLLSQPRGPVTIGVASTATGQATVTPDTLVFTAGDWNVPRLLSVSAVDDALVDGAQAFSLVFTSASAPADTTGYDGLAVPPIPGTANDDDVAGLVVSALALTTGESGATAAFTVVLARQPSATVAVVITGLDAAEGVLSTTSLLFTPANWSATQPVTVTGLADQVDDGDAVYALSLSATSTDPAFAAITPVGITVTNTDIDTAAVVITETGGGTAVSGSGGVDIYTIVLASRPSGIVAITVTPDSQVLVDGASAATVLTFDPGLSAPAAGAWDLARTVTVSAVQDVFDEAEIHPATITHAVSGYGLVTAEPVLVSVTDRAVPGLTLQNVSGSTSETGGSFTFTVALTTVPASTVAVTVGIPGSLVEEVAVSATTLVFAPADWSATQAVTVTGLADDVDDGDVSGVLTLTTASTDPTFAGLPPRQVSVVNADIDVSELVLDIGSGVVVAETGGSATYAIRLSSRPSATVAVTLVPDGQILAGGTSAAFVVLIPAADWAGGAVVTVRAAADTVDEANPHTGRITHTVAGFGPVNGPVLTATVLATIRR